MCMLVIMGSPSYPNPITFRYGDRADMETKTKRYFCVIGVVFVMMLLFPARPSVFAVANQVRWCSRACCVGRCSMRGPRNRDPRRAACCAVYGVLRCCFVGTGALKQGKTA